MKLYMDGNLEINFSTFVQNIDNTIPFYIGAQNDGAASKFQGYIDELRVSKGIARWTSNFTPPTAKYGSGGLFYKSSSGEEIQL